MSSAIITESKPITNAHANAHANAQHYLDDMRNLIVSLLAIIVVVYFFIIITKDLMHVLKNYLDNIRINETNRIYPRDDEYKYEADYRDYENLNHKILTNIREMRNTHNSEFKDLKAYKKKYNLNADIDNTISPDILTDSKDNYSYSGNSASFLDFISDLFRAPKI